MHQMTFLADAINLPQNLPRPASLSKAELGIERLIEVSEETGDKSLIADIENITSNKNCRVFLEAVFGNSSFLSQCAVTDPRFFADLIMAGPEASFKKIEQELTKSSDNHDDSSVMQFLRTLRKRAALTIAAADIANLWNGPEVTQALSRFSDLSVRWAIDYLLKNMATKNFLTLPEKDDPGQGSSLIVLGMGKLGGHELNYSSDVDIIVLPSLAMAACVSLLAPSPIASIAMTEQTPKTIPRVVRVERSLCIQRLLKPSFTVPLTAKMFISLFGPVQFARRAGVLSAVLFARFPHRE